MKVLLVTILCFVISCSIAQRNSQGLQAEYYQGLNFKKKVGSRIDREINFHWDQHHKPTPNIDLNSFSVRWRGQLYAPESGLYFFSSIADDQVKVWIDGVKILDNKQQPKQGKIMDTSYLTKKRGSVNLQAKQWVNIQVEYNNGGGKSEVVLYWELPSNNQSQLSYQGIFRKIIPAQNFIPVSKLIRSVSLVVNKHIVRKFNSSPEPKELGNQSTLVSPKQEVTSTTVSPELKLEKGKVVVLRQVQFAQSSFVLLADSYPVLNQLVNTLNQDLSRRVSIIGHTDNVGNARLNLILSEYRAKQVANYLIRQGIATNRIEIEGYGGTRPIANNNVEIERTKNRRVEVKLL